MKRRRDRKVQVDMTFSAVCHKCLGSIPKHVAAWKEVKWYHDTQLTVYSHLACHAPRAPKEQA